MPDHPQRELHCVVVTPEKALLDEAADFVAVPMFDGELGVLPGRAPLIGRLGFGELRIRRGMEVRRFFVEGGFVQVRANTVTVLTSKALRAEDIDTTAVSHSLQAALAPAPTPQASEEQLNTQQRARAQLRVARHCEENTARG
ncbi:MAG TPA: ATP synthase F1 subunit epsilon [Gemmataceae bacterium]|nr:ATP synthase F1 subunit epsilon [Gemmataceae bacterium]